MGAPEDLKVYRMAFELACKIQETTKCFPAHERYSLTDQIRRSSRSVVANLMEGYRKRHYPKSFISKLSDAAGENAETSLWLDFALEFKYIDEELHKDLKSKYEGIGKLLSYMMKNPEKFS
jgi:four helix bundle protein